MTERDRLAAGLHENNTDGRSVGRHLVAKCSPGPTRKSGLPPTAAGCKLLGLGCAVFALRSVARGAVGVTTEQPAGCSWPPSVLCSVGSVVSHDRLLLRTGADGALVLAVLASGRCSGPKICIREEGLTAPTSGIGIVLCEGAPAWRHFAGAECPKLAPLANCVCGEACNCDFCGCGAESDALASFAAV